MAGRRPKDTPKKKKPRPQPASSYLRNKKSDKAAIDQAFDHKKPKKKKGR